jgi:hypothetical protein
MSLGSYVQLIFDRDEQLRAGVCGNVIGFYRRPDSTAVVVSFAGRVETLPPSCLRTIS